MTDDPLAAVMALRSETCIGIDVPKGWEALMLELHEALVAVSPAIRYVQVKQKFAELRVYTSGGNDAAKDLIRDAELRSRTTCEECGEPGKPCVSSHRWYRALCPEHADAAGYRVAKS